MAKRWRFVFRQSDGSLTTRRGFPSRGSAVAARRTAIEQVRRGEVRASRETFAEFWASVLEAKRPYVTAGTLQDYATQGRKRLLPWFGELKLAAIDEDRLRAWLAEMAELVHADELNAKTVNNARTCLSRHPPAPAQDPSSVRLDTGQDRVECLAVDFANQAEPRGRAPAPASGRLRATDVVILHATGDRGRPGHGDLGLVEVALRLACSELADGDHRLFRPTSTPFGPSSS